VADHHCPGQAKILNHLEEEIGRARAKCPDALYVGIADEAGGKWGFLGRHTDVQVVDFWHAAEYQGKSAVVLYRGHPRTKVACPKGERYGGDHLPGYISAIPRLSPSDSSVFRST
jgi:hypothetical protein